MANVVLKNASGSDVTYSGVDTVRLVTSGGETVDFSVGGTTEYVAGSLTTITLAAADWNGTSQTVTLTYTDTTVYTNNLQIGIPPSSSASNADAVIAAGITLPYVSQSSSTSENDGVTTTTTTVQLTFSAITAPSVDVRIGVYGLLGGAN